MRRPILRLALLFLLSLSFLPNTGVPTLRVLVAGASTDQASQAVSRGGGRVEQRLAIIDGVLAWIHPQQQAQLRAEGLIVTLDQPVSTASTVSSNGTGIFPAEALGLASAHGSGLTGEGVTVAIVDSGLPFLPELNPRRSGRPAGAPQDGSLFTSTPTGQFLLYRDFLQQSSHSQDPYGHGTHVAGVIADGMTSGASNWRSVAPKANLVMARAIGPDGSGSYASAIAAIDWIVSIKNVYNIRVLNLSIYAQVASPYWADLLNRATMRAWQSGLIVVVAAGNAGPNPMSVSVPGNNPYVITVGAYRSAAVSGKTYDELAGFSGRGPTESRFVKPDVLAPGVRIVAALPTSSQLAASPAVGAVLSEGQISLAGSHSEVGFYTLNGTSMAAAEASGLIALLLQQRPSLSNDQVKWLLRRTTQIGRAHV